MARNFVSQASVGRYLDKLQRSVDREFQRHCFDLLLEIWPSLRYGKDLREFDRAGVDLYVPGKRDEFDVVVQCKGFEVFHFGKQQLRQCLDSIESFDKSGFRAGLYLLVINHSFIEDRAFAAQLEERLQLLEKAGKCGQAQLLTLQRFLNFLFGRLAEILEARIRSQNEHQLQVYTQAMGVHTYLRDVPFGLSRGDEFLHPDTSRRRAEKGPLTWLRETMQRRLIAVQEQPEEQVGKLWVLLASEFGFGKTSMLLRLASELNSINLNSLYLPIVQIPREGFNGETAFIRSVLQIILEGSGDANIHEPTLWEIPLRDLMRTRQDLVLLLDGLDEHSQAADSEGLRRIANCLRHMARHVVLSVRREFWDARAGDVQTAFGGSGGRGRNRVSVALTEWDDATILAYLESWNTGHHRGLEELIGLVKTGRYSEYYGDIPRRPLFLEMLTEEVVSGRLERITLTELYERCLLRKMKRDVASPFTVDLVPGRAAGLTGIDEYDLQYRLLDLLEELAAKTLITSESGKMQLVEGILESTVSEAASHLRLPAGNILPYLMRTVLVPTRARTPITELQVRFAHRSFQEYFVARHLWKDPARLRELEGKELPGAIGLFLKNFAVSDTGRIPTRGVHSLPE